MARALVARVRRIGMYARRVMSGRLGEGENGRVLLRSWLEIERCKNGGRSERHESRTDSHRRWLCLQHRRGEWPFAREKHTLRKGGLLPSERCRDLMGIL